MVFMTLPPEAASLSLDEVLRIDREHLWHPYARLGGGPAPLVVREAHGTRLVLADGRELVDAMSSWWAAVHGYRHPALDAAAAAQLRSMSHVMFGGLTHEPAARLGALLVQTTGMDTVFFCDSGSVAVEVAVKTALQYQRAAGSPGRRKLLTPRGGYYGDTFTPMSLCDPVGGMHSQWTGVLAEQVFAPEPPRTSGPAWDEEVRRIAAEHSHELAAVIVEPVVQGAGGMRMYDPRCLVTLREVADEHGLLLIFDEIATGFGRTGELFAAEHGAGVRPDIMCVGKALTGGYLTLAAVLGRRGIAEAINETGAGALLHGPTFMANPLACGVAVASVELLLASDWRGEVARIEQALARGLGPLRQAEGVRDVRVLGAIGVVQLDRPVDVARATATAVRHGVWLRPFRDLVYTMPPYIASDSDLELVCAAIRAVTAEEGSSVG
ncbi:adenosylmethionine-8-amino-7-oxononanoate aminotransferase [Segniliparus rotundus DSM 44985]|uniref:Adenosylmethionine-8-amino-7-oxononanoate aminotransferase n=2 Tax=Segniliparus rotundus TaxID=286802 RepID=D6ZF77_SEGRD|nr:adenosylmethionine-8-amino-7-oxononanoate aminotransferase [Segniliparus rotundus DSM 44985]